MKRIVQLLLAAPVLASCASSPPRGVERLPDVPAGAQAVSLLGKPLYAPAASDETAARNAQRLEEAKAAYAHAPENADSIIWLGRRTAYPGQFREAIEIFSRGIALYPRDARFYRHRGHRYITTRQLDLAIADLEQAARLIRGKPDEVEPDGLPNARNIPTGTLQFNIWYHLGLARYLKGDLTGSLAAYAECMKVSNNPDSRVATTHWMYTTLRRLHRDQDAAAVLVPISRGMDVIEDEAYHRLTLLYKGEITADQLVPSDTSTPITDVAAAYGVAAWHGYNGRPADAAQLYRRILATGQWPAFGYIAAEADVARGTASTSRGR